MIQGGAPFCARASGPQVVIRVQAWETQSLGDGFGNAFDEVAQAARKRFFDFEAGQALPGIRGATKLA